MQRIARFILAPLVLAMATIGLVATPSQAITGDYEQDFVHEYVGLIAFYDADSEFVHRCSGTLLSPTVFLTAGHCVTIDDATGALAPSARIWFEQDAGLHYDPATELDPITGYPETGGVTAHTMYSYDYRGLTVPNTHDVGLVILDEPITESKYDIDEFASLAHVGTLNEYGSGPKALVDQSGYGLTYDRGHDKFIESYRSRLMTTTHIISTKTGLAKGYSVQISAAKGGTCFGDSGGPTFLHNTDVQVAVTSFGLNPTCTGVSFEFRVDNADVQAWMQSVLTDAQWAEIEANIV
jgi:V8-like Glu-specific endopeptidase